MSLRGNKRLHPMNDDEPQSVETFSYDDDDNEANSDASNHGHGDDVDEDEIDDDRSSVMSSSEDNDDDNTVPFWKEHFWAIVIALVAACVGHTYNQYGLGNRNVSFTSSSPSVLPYLPPISNSVEEHDHLEGFERTSNIYFCQEPPTVSPSDNSLHAMEFYLSRDHFTTLERMYLEDETQEDTVPTPSVIPNSEYQCLLQQHMSKPIESKLKGWTYRYKEPTLEEMYPELSSGDDSDVVGLTPKSNTEKGVSASRMRKLQQPHLTFTGFAAKFVNLSNKSVLLWWDGKGGHEKSRRLVGEISPFDSIGTATMPGQAFHVTSSVDKSTALQRWVLTADMAVVYYEPLNTVEMKETGLEYDRLAYNKYQRQLMNREFARDYSVITGRTWLGNFPRQFPTLHMHPAISIGHELAVVDDGLTIRVESVTPRVFVIDNFLSKQECKEIIAQGQNQGMVLSTLHTSSSDTAKRSTDKSTRSSTNTWLTRDHSALTEKIYERAAMVTGIDAELMQKFHETNASRHSIAESLQVVRYKKGEEYTPHHDFVYPSVDDRFQGTRYATLLIYLNTVKEGGETRFPRAVNNHNSQGLEIAPKAGTAVLFYNVLNDGNYDDLSQHGSNPVQKGEKWLANLWLWDPVIG